MLRLAILLAFAFVASAVAAPVPKPSEKELLAKHWGKTEGLGEFELAGKQLTIRTAVPPDRGLIALLGNQQQPTMPRASRTVFGDFEVTVKVIDAMLPHKNAKHDSAWPNTRAGLFVEGGGYGIEFHLYQHFTKINGVPADNPTRCVWVDAWFPRGGNGSSLKAAEAGKSTWLRIIRKEKAMSASYSFDGTTWSSPFLPRQGLEMDFPNEVTVGVFFSHSTYQTLDATFDGFTVEKPKAEKPKTKKE
jgi:hypothetical protein